MTLITWTKDEFSTNVSETDQQHQHVFQALNQLHEILPRGERNEIGKQLDTFVDLVVLHFQTEERLMQQHNYPDYEPHKTAHEKIVKLFAELLKGFHEEGEGLSQASTIFIKDWLTEHIPNLDKPYGPFLNDKGIT